MNRNDSEEKNYGRRTALIVEGVGVWKRKWKEAEGRGGACACAYVRVYVARVSHTRSQTHAQFVSKRKYIL